MGAVDDLLKKIFETILDPIIVLLFVIAMIYFLWGLVLHIKNADSPEGHETGKRSMMYGLIGMVIMLSVFGITRMIANSYNLGTGPGIDGNPADQIFN